jgi:hypothetical protein
MIYCKSSYLRNTQAICIITFYELSIMIDFKSSADIWTEIAFFFFVNIGKAHFRCSHFLCFTWK